MSNLQVVFSEGEHYGVDFKEADNFSVDFGVSIPEYDYEGPYDVTPTEEPQILLTADRRLQDNIHVGAIPPQYIIPEGSQLITSNGIHDIADKATADVQVALTPIVLRPDAELIKSYTYDKKIYADEEIDLPGYTTTATTLKAAASLSPTITLDGDTDTFFIVERFLTIPEYSTSNVGKGRPEYTYCAYLYELARVPANIIQNIAKTKAITAVSNFISTMSAYRLLYWSSGSALSLYASNGYGCYQTPTAPTFSGTTLTIKSPALAVRGSTTYFTSTYMNALTDIRYQYIIDVYKAPKQALGIDGWVTNQLVNHIIDCVNSTTHTLT